MDDYSEDLHHTADNLLAELFERLEVDLSERDLCALSSAVSKAVTRAFVQGAAARDEAFRAVGVTIPVESEIRIDEVDEWQERFGDEETPDA